MAVTRLTVLGWHFSVLLDFVHCSMFAQLELKFLLRFWLVFLYTYCYTYSLPIFLSLFIQHTATVTRLLFLEGFSLWSYVYCSMMSYFCIVMHAHYLC